MKRFVMVGVILSLILTVGGCSSVTKITDEMREEAQSLCGLYQELREPVVIARDGAIQYWDDFSPEQREALQKIDSKLKDLDRAGKLACLVANDELVREQFDWNAIKAAMLDGLELVVELQQAGIIKRY